MCSSPITIPNPYYKLGDKGLNFLHDTVNTHIQVPCGKCFQCISLRQAYINQRVQMESLRSELFMLTLTYRESSLPRVHIGEYNLSFPDWKDVQNMFKRIRKILPHPIRYIMVSEYGTKRRRPHYHGIIAIERESIRTFYKGSVSLCEQKLSALILKEWRYNQGSTRLPSYYPCCDYVRTRHHRTFDFHHIVPIQNHENDVSFYVSKYITKYDETIHKLLKKIELDDSISEEQTTFLLKALKPRCTVSKDFGSPDYPPIREYITKCIQVGECELPQFYDIYTGQRSLLSRYYRKHCETIINALTRYYNSPSQDILSNHKDKDGTFFDWKCESEKVLQDNVKLNKIKNHLKRCDFD